jgi:hypothetical protein
MQRLISIIAALLLLLVSCSPRHLSQRDSTVIRYIDSIAWHDSTIISYLTKERYVDIVNPLDTLKLETTYAKATAYLDTANTVLKGSIENKDVPIETKIKWKEKLVYRDSIQIKEVEVPVEITKEVVKYPKSYWWFMGISILTVLGLALKIYLKFKL